MNHSKSCNCTIKLYTLRGYFDLIASVDEFILFDDVQFTEREIGEIEIR